MALPLGPSLATVPVAEQMLLARNPNLTLTPPLPPLHQVRLSIESREKFFMIKTAMEYLIRAMLE